MKMDFFGKTNLIVLLISVGLFIVATLFESYTIAGLAILIGVGAFISGIVGYLHWKASMETDQWMKFLYWLMAIIIVSMMIFGILMLGSFGSSAGDEIYTTDLDVTV